MFPGTSEGSYNVGKNTQSKAETKVKEAIIDTKEAILADLKTIVGKSESGKIATKKLEQMMKDC